MLPLNLADQFVVVDILVCGGAQAGANMRKAQDPCQDTCGRIRLIDAVPQWVLDTMPIRSCMGDMVSLPDENVLIINGALNGNVLD